MSEELHALVEQCVEDHHPADDWKCSCGEDLFGGSARYSWTLFKSHFAANAAGVIVARFPDLKPPHIGKVALTQEAQDERRHRREQAAARARNIAYPVEDQS